MATDGETAAPHLFLAYARRDAPVARRLGAALAAEGLHVWRDVERIAPGEHWEAGRQAALDRSAAFLFVASRNAIDHAGLAAEAAAAREAGKPAVALLVDEVGAARLPPTLRGAPAVDLCDGLDAAAGQVAALVADRLRAGAPVATEAERSRGYVFLSYASADAAFVRDLRGFLAGRGYAYWDFEESARDYQGPLFLELERAIGDAAAMLAVLSEAWKASRWTVREFAFCEQVGVPIFVLRAAEVGPTLATAGLPYIDFVGRRETGYETLARELARKGL